MLDFVSTHPNVDQQTQACARLLAAVIGQAAVDLSCSLSSEDMKAGRTIPQDARESVDFFYGKGSVFPLYASLIGSDAQAIRDALERKIGESEISNRLYTDTMRRHAQIRIRQVRTA